ncbi:hypothetical protein Desca_0503 [Desulfotomaculum nigrificans CO-1-SRB]|uniref:Uncharacterized protein n=1 Tax=Desulfotomaculum nigrificans (strain DSM 14880 / VKM B-2319 / CO-1-SRB) TaxID=868595 RepID=F6B7E5_DESCC|nr:hypothetical protein [Desulfotomaculum nigrificans]AEF93395.1 hypothetical protein Desca_0503 [Desulfotomaculum nigrificans CO-1-SRB]
MTLIRNFKEVVDIRKACGESDSNNCNNCSCPLKTKGTLGMTVCELVTSHIKAKPDSVEIVCNCPFEEDPLGIKDFFEHCAKGFIRPTDRQLQFMKQQQAKCQHCPANTRYKMRHPRLNIEISPHLCTTLKSTAYTIRSAAQGNSCCLISPKVSRKLPAYLDPHNKTISKF